MAAPSPSIHCPSMNSLMACSCRILPLLSSLPLTGALVAAGAGSGTPSNGRVLINPLRTGRTLGVAKLKR